MRTSVLGTAAGAFLLGSYQSLCYASQSESWHHERETPTTTNSNTTKEAAQFFHEYKSERVKITYGPFAVPPMSVDNGMKDYAVAAARKPCSDCLITWIQAGLEYPNGTVANANTGLWLHHTVFSNTNRTAIVCPQRARGDLFFASGNERTAANICVNGTDQAGYYIGPDDNLGLRVELMNMVDYSRDAVLTVTWEYIPSVPSGFNMVKPLWFDIGGCGSSDQPAKANTTFEYTDPVPWTSQFNGRITMMAGHLHDGGTHLTITKNNTVMCDFVAAYGQNPAYIDGGSMGMSSTMSGMSMRPRAATSMSGMSMGSSMDMSGMTGMSMGTSTSMPPSASTGMAGMNMGADTVHISSMSSCSNKGTIGIGDILSITAYYNSSEHSLMTNTDGTLAPIMGIVLAYVADMNLTSTAVNASGSGVTGTGAPSASASKSDGTREFASSLVILVLCCGLGWGMLSIL